MIFIFSGKTEEDLKWFFKNAPYDDKQKEQSEREYNKNSCKNHPTKCVWGAAEGYGDLGYYQYSFSEGKYMYN